MNFLFLTGLSGAGKSQAAHILEDSGCYCIDNMPLSLVPSFVKICQDSAESTGAAGIVLVADARDGEGIGALPGEMKRLRDAGHHCTLIFLDCSDEVIITRYKRSRRAHPIAARAKIFVTDAIVEERALLAPIRKSADYILDTTELSAVELADALRAILSMRKDGGMLLTCMSFGFQYGLPREADLVFDVRCFSNPFYVETLKEKTGLSPEVRDYVFASGEADEFLTRTYAMLDYMLPLYAREGKMQLTIAIGCTGGRHRSVAITEKLYQRLAERYANIIVRHRDVNK